MKIACLIPVICLVACSNPAKNNQTETTSAPTAHTTDTVPAKPDSVATVTEKAMADSAETKTYANTRFKDVTVKKTGDNKYQISGKGQIFEANFGWVIEDGHNELQTGHQMTDAGAPEWGNFTFTVDAKKDRPNSALTLILFETSAKDGSRQHQLPIPLQ